MRRLAIIGPQGSGKTTCLLDLVGRLRAYGFRVAGIVQPALDTGATRQGYDLLDVASGERRSFATRIVRDREGSRFALDESGFAWAKERLLVARAGADVLVIDELGRKEASGAGHLPALLACCGAERVQAWLMGVRAEAAARIASLLGPFEAAAAPSRNAAVLDDLAARIAYPRWR